MGMIQRSEKRAARGSEQRIIQVAMRFWELQATVCDIGGGRARTNREIERFFGHHSREPGCVGGWDRGVLQNVIRLNRRPCASLGTQEIGLVAATGVYLTAALVRVH
jgi:hypothetical protein